MPVPTLDAMPCQFTAGDTVIFQSTFSDYPTSAWGAKLWISNQGGTPIEITGVVDGVYFVFTIPAATSAPLAQGLYDWTIRLTETIGGEVAQGRTGQVFILPNPSVAQTPSFAQTMVETLQTAIETLGTSTDQSVSFNGQSFTQANLDQYRKDLAWWMARVIMEQKALQRAKGNLSSAQYSPRFNAGGGPWYPNALGIPGRCC